ncbi:MAG: transglycosylase SLT domain-containing protein, partial [Gammaproteobacteria bacterium]
GLAIIIQRNILLLLGLILSFQVSAAGTDSRFAEQRQNFVAAEKALKRGKFSEYKTLRKGLTNYPLYPYLEYAELRYGFSDKKLPRVKKFLDQYPDLPLSSLLRSAWLNQLAKKKRWSDLLELYTPQENIQRQCNYLHALIEKGQQDKAFKLVEPIWSYGSSRPDDCTPVFNAWRKAGKLTTELVWKRIELSMQENETTLARYLRRYLPPLEKRWLDQWLQIHNHPERLRKGARLRGPERLRMIIMSHGVQRLARRNLNTALSVWKKLQTANQFPAKLQQQVEHAIAMRMISTGHKQSLKFLDQITPEQHETLLHEKRIRLAQSKRKWKLVSSWIQRLPDKLKTSDEWRYWLARSLAEQGQPDKANNLFKQLTKQRGFYAFLAADRLSVEYDLNHQPLKVGSSILKQLESNKGLQRSRELFRLDRNTEGRREWRAATAKMNPGQLKGAAILAHKWGLDDRSVAVITQAGLWDDLKLRFPLAHRKQVDKRAREKNLESAWVFAVIRQESAFIQDARSPTGALGLMQLMPRTARSTARMLKMGHPKTDKILQPETNIRLGTAYLRVVLDELWQNRILATAAYNAGPGRVRGWLSKKAVPADLWIATVPLEETRVYLKRVLAYTVIYEQLLGQKPQRLMDLMSPIQRNPGKASEIANIKYPHYPP